jgi:hypothetical protein
MKFNKYPKVLAKRKILIQNYLASNLAQSLLTNLKNITKRKHATITFVNEGTKQSVSS